MNNFTIVDHPLISHKLTMMRMKETSSKDFRELARELATLMAYEVTNTFELRQVEIETPICKTTQPMLADKDIVIVPILRAGLGMVEGFTSVMPNAKIGHLGLFRDPETLKPVEYFCKMPKNVENFQVIIVDPMLATGGSSIKAIETMKARGCTNIQLVVIVACPEGVKAVSEAYPDVPMYAAAVDDQLNDHAYIVPGLGDAGDRLFGTL